VPVATVGLAQMLVKFDVKEKKITNFWVRFFCAANSEGMLKKTYFFFLSPYNKKSMDPM